MCSTWNGKSNRRARKTINGAAASLRVQRSMQADHDDDVMTSST